MTKLYSNEYGDTDIDIVKVLKFTKNFREIKYIDHFKTKSGKKLKTIHTITILPKLNNKINYMMKFSAYTNHYNARGTCKKNN